MKPYRILVTGSRDWEDQQAVYGALADIVRELPVDREIIIVHGNCRTGADQMADVWGRKYGATIERHRAEDFGRWPRCGPLRNRHMVSLGADVCLAFIRNGSRGASHTARLAEEAGIPTRRWTA